MDQFAVVTDRYEAPPPEKLAALLQGVCGLPMLDARQKASRACGIVAERLPADVAERLRFALGNLQFPASLLPQAVIPATVKGRRVQFILAGSQQLGVRWSPTGKPRFYPWSEVLVISAAVVFRERKEQVLHTVEQHGLLSGRHMPNYTTEVTQRDTSHDVAMAAITLGRTPQQLETFRIRATEMEYATMFGEAQRANPLENFCLLLARIGTHATDAHITDETLELMAAASATPRLPKSPRFDSEDEFDRYQRWLVARKLAG